MASVTLLTNIETFEYPYQSNYKLYIWPDEAKKSWQLPANNKITNIQYTITYDGRIGGTASAVGLWFEGNIDSSVEYGHDDGFDDIAGTGVLKMDISKVHSNNLFGENSDLRITIRPVNPDVHGAKTIARKLLSQIILTIEYEPQADPSHATVNTVNLGTTQLINIQTYVGGEPQDVSGLFHTVELTYGEGANKVSKTWTKTTSYSLSFTPTTNEISKLCNYSPTSTDLEGKLTIATYLSDDDTAEQVGTSWTTKPHMTITDTVAGPRALDSALGHAYKADVPDAIRDSEKPYQNWSIFSVETKFEWVNTQTGQITVTCTDGQITKTGDKTWTATPTVSGAYVITATATDARGFTASYSWTATLEPCAGPVFTRIDVHRCISTSNTDENDEGEYCYVYVAFATNEIPGNETGDAPQINVSILDMSGEPVAEKTAKAESVTETVLTTVLGGNLAKDMNYRVNIELSDAINLKTTTTTTLGQAFYTVHRMAGGKGIAFGTISTTEGVTVNPDWPLYTHGQEIEHLILNAAHPIGSALETIDSGFNPSTLWPWTVWGRIATQTLDGMTVYLWVRAR